MLRGRADISQRVFLGLEPAKESKTAREINIHLLLYTIYICNAGPAVPPLTPDYPPRYQTGTSIPISDSNSFCVPLLNKFSSKYRESRGVFETCCGPGIAAMQCNAIPLYNTLADISCQLAEILAFPNHHVLYLRSPSNASASFPPFTRRLPLFGRRTLARITPINGRHEDL